MRKALYLPGPSYFDPEVEGSAGWHKILVYQKEAIEDAGYEVVIPYLDHLVDTQSSIGKISSYAWTSAYEHLLQDDAGDIKLVVGAPSYAHQAFLVRPKWVQAVAYVWNTADWWREHQLREEYPRFHSSFSASLTNSMANSLSVNMVDRVIACSPWVRETWSKIMKEPERCVVAPWGVDSARFTPASRPERPFTILFSGADPIRKGMAYLVQALDKLRNLDVNLVVVGNRWLEGREMPVPTEWLGLVPFDQVAEIYQRAHVVCIPTLEDGIACAIQECMACGAVPIATPEAAEVFTAAEGFTVEYREVNGISAALMDLYNDRERLRRMGQSARRLAESQTWVSFKRKFTEIIKELD